MGSWKLGVSLSILVSVTPAWACKTSAMVGSYADYDAIFTYLRKKPELARYNISKIEKDSAMYFISLESLNDVKCQLSVKVQVAADCVRTVTSFGENSCQ